MDYSPLYQKPNSRDSEDFNSDIRSGAIDTANQYINEQIDSSLSPEERIEALTILAEELATDEGNIYIVAEVRARISIEKSALNMQADSLFV